MIIRTKKIIVLKKSSYNHPWYGHAALDVPAAYVKQIQSGEFLICQNYYQAIFLLAMTGSPSS